MSELTRQLLPHGRQRLDCARPLQLSATAALIDEVQSGFAELPDRLQQILANLEAGLMLAEGGSTDHDQWEAVYCTAYELCEEARWSDALPLLMYLVAHQPFDARFHFAAGMCLQQLGQALPAALCHGQAVLLDPDDAASAFRLGESLLAAGQEKEAAQAFRMALELINRNFDQFHALYTSVIAHLAQLPFTASE